MNDTFRKSTLRNNPIAVIIFYIVCIFIFPAILVGYVLWIIKALAGRASGVSGTAQAPLSARWFQHQLGIRRDEPANRLLMVLPSVSPLAVQLVFGPMLIASRLSGFVPQAFQYPFEGNVSLQNQSTARQTFYDSVVDRYITKVAQFVILGAGFDTRAFRLPKEIQIKVRSFEVDTPKTLATQCDVLKLAGIDLSGTALVGADFEKKDWIKRLEDAGFDTNKTTLFIWEGVTPYLDRDAVEDTLRKIASTAKGSLIAFDYFTTEVLDSKELYFRMIRTSLSAGGEPLKFGVDSTPPSSDRIAELLRSCGLSLGEVHILGQEKEGKRSWGGFVIAIVK